jgi:hypothetical protein
MSLQRITFPKNTPSSVRKPSRNLMDSHAARTVSTMTGGTSGRKHGASAADDREGGRRQPGKWKTVRARTSGSKPDSYLHRYAREVGFLRSEEDNRDMDGNVAVSAAMRQIDEQTSDLVANRIKAQADFECWVLTKGHGTGYHNFLGRLQQCFDSNGNLKMDREYPKVAFQPPSASVVAAWVVYLRNDRQLSHDTIDGLLAGLSAVKGQFAGTSIDRSNLKELMNQWNLHDNATGRKKQAPAFDMRFDLPKLMCAVFSMTRYTDLA